MLEQLDLIGKTSEMARLFGIQFLHVLTRGSQVGNPFGWLVDVVWLGVSFVIVGFVGFFCTLESSVGVIHYF